MAALQIRSVPEDIREWLSQEAAAQHRSINQQALVVLKEYKRFKEMSDVAQSDGIHVIHPLHGEKLEQDEQDKRAAKRRALYEEIKALNKRTGFVYPESLPSPAEMIREDRDR